MMNPVKRTSDSAHEHNRIVEGAVFEGSIQSPVDIRVDGIIKGNVIIHGKLVVGPTGTVEGEVVAAEASIAGKLRGSLEVKGLTTLAQTAQVQAELYTGQISIEAGAQFSGNCHMGPKEPISKPINPQSANNPAVQAPVPAVAAS
jgi:cytoskeletal protein CcmA (bactofilin family)